MPIVKEPLKMRFSDKTFLFPDVEWGYDYRNDGKRSYAYKIYREYLLNKYKKCAYCGSDKKLEIDHIEPVSRGGSEEIDNLIIACKKCNNKKHNKLLSELNVNFILRF